MEGAEELRDGSSEAVTACCVLCGRPMPPGEEMFKFHGYSGPCPGVPLKKSPWKINDKFIRFSISQGLDHIKDDIWRAEAEDNMFAIVKAILTDYEPKKT